MLELNGTFYCLDEESNRDLKNKVLNMILPFESGAKEEESGQMEDDVLSTDRTLLI